MVVLGGACANAPRIKYLSFGDKTENHRIYRVCNSLQILDVILFNGRAVSVLLDTGDGTFKFGFQRLGANPSRETGNVTIVGK